MKLFGFEVSGIQVIYVKCPKCGSPSASITFAPSEKNVSLSLLNLDVTRILTEMKLMDYFQLPSSDDVHFLCMHCMSAMKQCEQFKKECKIQVKKVEETTSNSSN
jgi:hypothetical protein